VLRRGKQETIQNVRLAEASSPQGYRTAVRLRQLAGAKDAEIMITVTRKGNRITLIRNEGPLMITVEAEAADGKNKVASIAIIEKGQTGKYGKVEEVPEPHRAKVQHLLQLLDSTDFRRSGLRLIPQVGETDFRFELLLPQSTPAPLNLEVEPRTVPQKQPTHVQPGASVGKDLDYRVPDNKSAPLRLNFNALPELRLEGELQLSGDLEGLLQLHNPLPKTTEKKPLPAKQP